MSFANAELKYRLQRREAQRAADTDTNEANQKIEKELRVFQCLLDRETF